jgi:hypothetical protein
MVSVISDNGHVKAQPGREILSAGPAGAFFCVEYGPLTDNGYAAYRLSIEALKKPTILKVYYTADMGRELFRVEEPKPIVIVPKVPEPKQNWWVKLIIRKRKRGV